MAFDAAERNEYLTSFSVREVTRVAAEEKERDEYSYAKGPRESK